MVFIKYNNPDVTDVTSTLTADADYNATVLAVVDASSFSADDFILIELQGSESNEISQIDSISVNNITLKAGTELSHITGVTITKLNYDKYKIAESTDNIVYTDLVTGDLKYQDVANKIRYDYIDWDIDNYYRVIYYNSETDTELVASTQNGLDNFGYITVTDLRNETNISTSIADNTLIEGILFGVDWIKDTIYNTKLLETNNPDNIFMLDTEDMELADWNCDSIIDKEDFTIYEVDTNDKRTYLLHKVAKVFARSQRMEFTEDVPRSQHTLVIQSPVTFRPLSDIVSTLRQVNKLLAVNYILSNVPTERLVKGEFSWTAGGTTVTYDPDRIQDAIEKNDKFITTIANTILKTYIRTSSLRTRASQFRRGTYAIGTLRSPYGGR